MKKIIISLAVIGVVSAVVIGGTIAYFSDTGQVVILLPLVLLTLLLITKILGQVIMISVI